MGSNGRKTRDRDHALTWHLPPSLQPYGDDTVQSSRAGFLRAAELHLARLVEQQLEEEGVEESRQWATSLVTLAWQAAECLSPVAITAHGTIDPRQFIKVKRVADGGHPASSAVVQGVVFRKNLAHKRMRTTIGQAKILILTGALEYQPTQSNLQQFDALLSEEQAFLQATVARIASYSPDVLLVERSVARYAQELLMEKDITLVLNVKLELLERVSQCTGAEMLSSMSQLSAHALGFCKEFEVESIAVSPKLLPNPPQLDRGSAGPAGVSTLVSNSPRAALGNEQGHLIADAAALQKSAATSRSGKTSLMLFKGCARPMGCTILLKGSSIAELTKVKRVAAFAAYAAYWSRLEAEVLANQLASAAAAEAAIPEDSHDKETELSSGVSDEHAPCSGMAAFWEALAAACAEASAHEAADARKGQLILSPSPHVVFVERQQVPTSEAEKVKTNQASDSPLPLQGLEVPANEPTAVAKALHTLPVMERDVHLMKDLLLAEISSASDPWVVPADTDRATITVTGPAIDALDSLTARPVSSNDLTSKWMNLDKEVLQLDPLTQAAQELKQNLNSVSDDISTDAHENPRYPVSSTGLGVDSVRAGSGTAASSPKAALSKLQTGCSADSLASSASSIYSSQQLWVSISCKNPAKGILCEPPHTHCMHFYANQDMPLADFLAAATPAHRKCPHPACGDGAMLHLRSFMHGDGMLTLSSVKLPAGQELPGKDKGQVWVWLRPLGQKAEAQENVRRVPLSAGAACISFAHLLALLLDGRFLGFGGQSLQRNYVRYLGSGSTVLCLHHSCIASNSVCLPDPQVALVPKDEVAWLLEEIKALTEEADEAFSAVQYALVQQLQPLEEKDPGFVQSWISNLSETQAAFMELAARAALEAYSLQEGEGVEQPGVLATPVWDVNRLRRLLAYEVLQWATALHEGTPVSRAEPPQAMAASLDARTRLSRQGSIEGAPLSDAGKAASAKDQALAAAAETGDSSPRDEGRLEEIDGISAPEAPPSVGLPPLPPDVRSKYALAEQQGQVGALSAEEQRRGGRSPHVRNWSFDQQAGGAASQAAGYSYFAHANYAPSLQDGGTILDADGTTAGQSDALTVSHAPEQPAPIPIGLVARYVALFDQGRTKGEPNSPLNAQQRTYDWVQHASPSNNRARSTSIGAVGSPRARNDSQQSLSKHVEQGEQAGRLTALSDVDDDDLACHIGDMRASSGGSGGLIETGRSGRRPSMLIDLANPDPGMERLATVLSPRSQFEESKPADAQHSALERLANRFGRMSLHQSLSELQGERMAKAAAAPDLPYSQQDEFATINEEAGPVEASSNLANSTPEAALQGADGTIPTLEGRLQPQSSSISVSHFEEWGDLLLRKRSGPTFQLAGSTENAAKMPGVQDAVLGAPQHVLQEVHPDALLTASSSPATLTAAHALIPKELPDDIGHPNASSASAVLSSALAADSTALSLPQPLHPAASLPVTLAGANGAGQQESLASNVVLPAILPAAKQPSKLKQLLSKLRLEPQADLMPHSAGKVELSGRSLLPPGLEDVFVTIFDEEPTSVVAYFLSTRVYSQYLQDAILAITTGETHRRTNALSTAASTDAVVQNDSANPGLSQEQRSDMQAGSGKQQPSHDSASSTSWQVLFNEQRLDCQLSIEDMSPGMPCGRTKFQVVAYYAPQFSELRRRCVAGGEEAFLAAISRCRKWASQGGKSNVYFAKTRNDRCEIHREAAVKSEKQSFLEFAPDYFRYVSTALHKGQETCLAKILGVFQVTVKYANSSVHPFGAPAAAKDVVMDFLVMENIFYGRSISRIYDLKGSERDRYAADNPAMAGAVLLDENLKEVNLSSPTLVTPEAYAKLQRALWSDTAFLSSLGVMDYSLLVGIDKQSQELVVGVIDFIRQYTWDKQVETWVKKSGILGGAGKDPTVISPKQYSRRFRIAISGYFTVVPSQQQPPAPLDPDAV